MVTKINLGCGPVGKEDWINIDWGILAILHKYPRIEKMFFKLNLFPRGYNVRWPKNLKLHNCKKKLPFDPNSADYIYASHFLEHFKKFEAEEIIIDCHRVLKDGGIIRIVVPDLELLVRKYLEKDFDYFRKTDDLMNFGKENKKDSKDILLADILMNNFYPEFYRQKVTGWNKVMTFFIRPHLWMYDYESLKSLLETCGFKKIERKLFKKGNVPNLDQLDVFPEMSLYVEAEK
jgi:predicted SAM-dependent methyltransferase